VKDDCPPHTGAFVVSADKLRTSGGYPAEVASRYLNSIAFDDAWTCVSLSGVIQWDTAAITAGLILFSETSVFYIGGVQAYVRPTFSPGYGLNTTIGGNGCPTAFNAFFGDAIDEETEEVTLEIRLNYLETDPSIATRKLWHVCILVNDSVVYENEFWLRITETLYFGAMYTIRDAITPLISWDNITLKAN